MITRTMRRGGTLHCVCTAHDLLALVNASHEPRAVAGLDHPNSLGLMHGLETADSVAGPRSTTTVPWPR
jgi:hypothetical protein